MDEIRDGTLPCPVCGKPMRIESKEKVEVDVCTDHGVWLDKGEFEEVARAIRSRTERFQRSLRRVAVEKATRDGRTLGAHGMFWWLLLLR